MPLICLEGASAVGKSTTAQALADMHNAYVIAEPAFLFQRPSGLTDAREELTWLLECHLERWKMAVDKLKTCDLVVLDGDPIKMWYDWVYGMDGATFDFFRSNMGKRLIGFPDAYFILHIDEENLRARKSNDAGRRRRNFDKHLTLIEPQKRFFSAFNQWVPGYTTLIDAQTVEQNVRVIMESLDSLPSVDRYSVWLFDCMVRWFEENRPL